MYKHIPLFFILLLVQAVSAASLLHAQEVEDVDSAFEEARQLAFDGEREAARELARGILEISPGYHDVRILIARTYSWDGNYGFARSELETVLQQNPQYKDALSAAIDNEIWSENPLQAVELGETATRFYPLDESLLIKLATAQNSAGLEIEAIKTLDRVRLINPSNEAARDLRESIQNSSLNHTLSISYTHDRFSDVFDPWHKTHLQLSRNTPLGSIIARINYSNRFGSDGFQPEIDLYPSIADGLYGYLNIGYTRNTLYPEVRFGSELYKRLPGSFEISAGFRHLRFEASDITIFTGSLSKYLGNWYFSVRPYITPSSVGSSKSLNLSIRKYLDGPENYITVRGGFGFSPEERRFQDVSGDVFLVRSQYLGIDLFKSIHYNFALFAAFDISRQELQFDPGRYIQVYTFNSGVQVKF